MAAIVIFLLGKSLTFILNNGIVGLIIELLKTIKFRLFFLAKASISVLFMDGHLVMIEYIELVYLSPRGAINIV